ncbi:Isopentenyldiphosphate isomerase [Halobacillus karajensis]|uniref:Isopentenyl-diphosphate Delta-isomerase n=1 Tax=Halobacillus karajensis TaxID=195088 RepID=A0A024P9H7_9BACI|nr:Isopentenyl-diphosphate Delta-isomerase [Halobacillus karajensis]CDQ25513.1 Isopentenyl-diphosphate Delta-isomerase [Halobacillus karajensis]CDQ28957.1 Isopentenyl-diphosphate Delta-isomerase [Halobacillus karajensis]SEI08799.1 Isopentenyldiphosphate isomerase [Halobacillus karajensis]
MAEMLTIFNENGLPAGVKDREDVHRDGDWHETFHCWMISLEEKEIVLFLQQRSENKRDFPSLYDITAAGHIEAGEDVIEAGVREIKEEVGLTVHPAELIHAGNYKEELKQGVFIDREICRVYLYLYEGSANFQLGEEVEDLIRVSLDDMESLVEMNTPITGCSVVNGIEKEVKSEEFVPHEMEYGRFLIRAVHEHVTKL